MPYAYVRLIDGAQSAIRHDSGPKCGRAACPHVPPNAERDGQFSGLDGDLSRLLSYELIY